MKENERNNKNTFGTHWEKISREREKDIERGLYLSIHPSILAKLVSDLSREKKWMCDECKTQVISFV